MAIDVQLLTQQMLSAAIPVLKVSAPTAEPLARLEFTKLAHTIVYTHGQLTAGQLSREEGSAYLDLQKTASRSALTGLPGLSLLTAEQAINAAYGAARKTVSAAGVAGVVGPWPP
jgi:hypothetical protein